MNKIYRIIWSDVRHAYTVVSEIAKAQGKKTGESLGKPVRALLAAAVLTCGFFAAVQAADAPTVAKANNYQYVVLSSGGGVWQNYDKDGSNYQGSIFLDENNSYVWGKSGDVTLGSKKSDGSVTGIVGTVDKDGNITGSPNVQVGRNTYRFTNYENGVYTLTNTGNPSDTKQVYRFDLATLNIGDRNGGTTEKRVRVRSDELGNRYTVVADQNQALYEAEDDQGKHPYYTDAYVISYNRGDTDKQDDILSTTDHLIGTRGVTTNLNEQLQTVHAATFVSGATGDAGTFPTYHYFIYDNGQYKNMGLGPNDQGTKPNQFVTVDDSRLRWNDTFQSYLYTPTANSPTIEVPIDNMYVINGQLGIFTTSDGNLYTGTVYGNGNEYLLTKQLDDGTGRVYSFWAMESNDPSLTMKDYPVAKYNEDMLAHERNEEALARNDIHHMSIAKDTDETTNRGTINLWRNGTDMNGQETDANKVDGLTLEATGGTGGISTDTDNNDRKLTITNDFDKKSATFELGSKVGQTSDLDGDNLKSLTINGKTYGLQMDFQDDNGNTVTKNLSETLPIKGDNNITTAASDGSINFTLKKNLDLGDEGSVKMGNTTINNGGVTITNQDTTKNVSLTVNGLNNGGNTITNVASGGDTNTNAANIGDVHRIAKADVQVNGDDNITVKSNTVGEVRTDTVTLNDVITLGGGEGQNSVKIDGPAGTVTAGNALMGHQNVSNKKGTEEDGEYVTGLTNTTWRGNDSIVSGRAATEDQLGVVDQKVDGNTTNINSNTENINKNTTAINAGWHAKVSGNDADINITPTKNALTFNPLGNIAITPHAETGTLDVTTTDNAGFTTLHVGDNVGRGADAKDGITLGNQSGLTREFATTYSELVKDQTGGGYTIYTYTNKKEDAETGNVTYTQSAQKYYENGTPNGEATVTENYSHDSLNNTKEAKGLYVTGLENKAWSNGSIVSGRAATEDQLAQVAEEIRGQVSENDNFVSGGQLTSDENGNVQLTLDMSRSTPVTVDGFREKFVNTFELVDNNGKKSLVLTRNDDAVDSEGKHSAQWAVDVSDLVDGYTLAGDITDTSKGDGKIDLGKRISLKGGAAKDDLVDAANKNIGVTVAEDEDGNADVTFQLNKNLTGLETVTAGGTKLGTQTPDNDKNGSYLTGLTNKDWYVSQDGQRGGSVKNGDTISYVSGRAATEDQLLALQKSITTYNGGDSTTGGDTGGAGGGGFALADADGKKATQNLGGAITIKGSNSNITTTASNTDSDKSITVALSDDLKLNSVTTGDENTGTTINQNGITINNGGDENKKISITNKEISMGGQRIQNVGRGVADTDAVNVGQLKEFQAAANKQHSTVTVNNRNDTGNLKLHITGATETSGANYDVSLSNQVTLGNSEGDGSLTIQDKGGKNTTSITSTSITTGTDGNEVKMDGETGQVSAGVVKIGNQVFEDNDAKVVSSLNGAPEQTPSVKDGVNYGGTMGVQLASGTTGSIWTDKNVGEWNDKDGNPHLQYNERFNNAANIGDIYAIARQVSDESAAAPATRGRNIEVNEAEDGHEVTLNDNIYLGGDYTKGATKDDDKYENPNIAIEGEGKTGSGRISIAAAEGDKNHTAITLAQNSTSMGGNQIHSVGSGYSGQMYQGRSAAETQMLNNAASIGDLETKGAQITNRLGGEINKLSNRVDKVGAGAAALANLHPLEFDADSKWSIAAAVGNYRSATASAMGLFYRPNEDLQFNVSTSFGNGENMVGGGVSFRLGRGGNKAKAKVPNDVVERLEAENQELRAKVDNLTARMDALLSVINPAMSQDFPDVPQNHWAYEAVSKLAGSGIVQGFEDGQFHGEETMTRYQMAEIIYNALAKGVKAEQKLVEEFKPELQAMAAQKSTGSQK